MSSSLDSVSFNGDAFVGEHEGKPFIVTGTAPPGSQVVFSGGQRTLVMPQNPAQHWTERIRPLGGRESDFKLNRRDGSLVMCRYLEGHVQSDSIAVNEGTIDLQAPYPPSVPSSLPASVCSLVPTYGLAPHMYGQGSASDYLCGPIPSVYAPPPRSHAILSPENSAASLANQGYYQPSPIYQRGPSQDWTSDRRSYTHDMADPTYTRPFDSGTNFPLGLGAANEFPAFNTSADHATHPPTQQYYSYGAAPFDDSVYNLDEPPRIRSENFLSPAQPDIWNQSIYHSGPFDLGKVAPSALPDISTMLPASLEQHHPNHTAAWAQNNTDGAGPTVNWEVTIGQTKRARRREQNRIAQQRHNARKKEREKDRDRAEGSHMEAEEGRSTC